jgi:hypothetical protein
LAQHKIAVGEALGINMGLARQRVFDGQLLLAEPQPSEEKLLGAVGLFQEAWLLALNAPRWPGDVNGDGNVDLTDFGVLKSTFGTEQPQADFDGDGQVGLADFGILKARFGTHPTPEPAAVWLAAVGALSMVLVEPHGRRRRRRSPRLGSRPESFGTAADRVQYFIPLRRTWTTGSRGSVLPAPPARYYRTWTTSP